MEPLANEETGGKSRRSSLPLLTLIAAPIFTLLLYGSWLSKLLPPWPSGPPLLAPVFSILALPAIFFADFLNPIFSSPYFFGAVYLLFLLLLLLVYRRSSRPARFWLLGNSLLILAFLPLMPLLYGRYTPYAQPMDGYEMRWLTQPANAWTSAFKNAQRATEKTGCHYTLHGWDNNNILYYADSCRRDFWRYDPATGRPSQSIAALPAGVNRDDSVHGRVGNSYPGQPPGFPPGSENDFLVYETAFSPDGQWWAAAIMNYYGPRDVVVLTAVQAPQPFPEAPAAQEESPPLPVVDGLQSIGYLGSGAVQALAVADPWLMVAGGYQLRLYALRPAAEPALLSTLVLPEPILAIADAGTYAYLLGRQGALFPVNLNDPARPTTGKPYRLPHRAQSILVSNNRLYAAGGGLAILDISDPEQPAVLNQYGGMTPAESIINIAAVKDGLAYLAFYDGAAGQGGLSIVDIRAADSPVEVSRYTTPGQVAGLAVAGSFAYLLAGGSPPLLHVIDISRPEQPVNRNDALGVSWVGHKLAADESTLYLFRESAGGEESELHLLEMANPQQAPFPQATGRFPAGINDLALSPDSLFIADAGGLSVVARHAPASFSTTARLASSPLGPTTAVLPAGDIAYTAGPTGLAVVDISRPEQPQLLDTLPTPAPLWDLAQDGDHLYAAAEYAGLLIYDLTDPRRPQLQGRFMPPGQLPFFASVAIRSGLAYVADGSPEQSGLWTLDVSDPERPVEIGVWWIPEMPDLPLPPRAEGLALNGSHLFLAAGTAGLFSLDVSDPAAPREIGRLATSGRAAAVVVWETTAVVADGDLRLIDISNPATPNLIGFYDLPETASQPRLALSGSRLLANDHQGLWLLDVSTPAQPYLLAHQPITGLTNVALAAPWAYAAGPGLFILK